MKGKELMLIKILFLFTSTALAVSVPNRNNILKQNQNNIHNVRFYQPNDPDLGVNPSIGDALLRFDQGHGNGDCSGSFISDEGHILTAAHCVRSCIDTIFYKRQ